MESPSREELKKRYVLPFYRQMMRTNALEHGQALVPALREVAREVSSSDLTRLLGFFWRERVMGAWLALTHTEAAVTDAVLHALKTSHGSLDSPPLATAAVTMAGPAAVPALTSYLEADLANRWGAAGIIVAAGDYLRGRYGVEVVMPPPAAKDIETFAALLVVASELGVG